MSEHKVVPVTDGTLDYSVFAPTGQLPIIDEAAVLEQCGDWQFIAELLQDVMAESASRVDELRSAVAHTSHKRYHETAHAIKGAALNLHLPALVDVSKKAELLGKQLEISPTDARLLASRDVVIAALQREYDRLNGYIPTAQQNAAAEQAAGGSEGMGGGLDGEDPAFDDYDDSGDYLRNGG